MYCIIIILFNSVGFFAWDFYLYALVTIDSTLFWCIVPYLFIFIVLCNLIKHTLKPNLVYVWSSGGYTDLGENWCVYTVITTGNKLKLDNEFL